MHTTSENISDSGFGCVEDRAVSLLNGSPTDVEFRQIMGADMFQVTVLATMKQLDGKLIQTEWELLEDAVESNTSNDGAVKFNVHNDDAHGSEFEGCGYEARKRDIFRSAGTETGKHIESVEASIQLADEQKDRLMRFGEALLAIADNDEFWFKGTRGELIEGAHKKLGANLITYTGSHVASKATITESAAQTYDSRAPESDAERTFNLDPEAAVQIAQKYGYDPQDVELLAELLFAATVHVLSNGAISKIDKS